MKFLFAVIVATIYVSTAHAQVPIADGSLEELTRAVRENTLQLRTLQSRNDALTRSVDINGRATGDLTHAVSQLREKVSENTQTLSGLVTAL
jgi:hypothetical protein